MAEDENELLKLLFPNGYPGSMDVNIIIQSQLEKLTFR